MLVIQIIELRWSKASRGGEGARIRNQTPKQLPLPPGYEECESLLHHVIYREEENFEPRASISPLNNPVGKTSFPGVKIMASDYRLQVDFDWDFFATGAPKRRSHPVFGLTRDEFGRFRFNGRIGSSWSDGREWQYFEYTYNFLITERYEINAFCDKDPDKDHSEMADLK
jgi:hypothetical protein